MKRIVLTLIGLVFLNFSFGQKIDMRLNLLGFKFEQNGERLSWKKLVNATESNIESNVLIKKAKSQNRISKILAFTSGGLVGIPFGQSAADAEPSWTLAYIGVGMAAVGLTLALSAPKNARKGIDLYNCSLKSTSSYFEPEFEIIANGYGIGLAINF